MRVDGRADRRLRWVEGVAVVTDGQSLCAIRGAEAAQEWLFMLPRPALVVADGPYADVAVEAADITVVRNDLNAVVDAILLSRATLAKIRQNLFFAFVYNVLGIPLAALGMLNPVFAGAAMAASSLSVVGNALLLRRWRPKQ